MEVWKNIKDYEGMYQVSNKGRVKSLNRTVKKIGCKGKPIKGKIIKPFVLKTGYENLNLCKNGKCKTTYIHRLVAEAFLKKQNGKNFVNHKDLNKLNNKVENLEWCTCAENNIHAHSNKKFNYLKGETHKSSKLTEEDIYYIRNNKDLSREKLAKKYNVTKRTICNVINKKTWKHLD